MALGLPDSTLPIPSGKLLSRWGQFFIVVCSGKMRENTHKGLMGFKEKFFHYDYRKAMLRDLVQASSLEFFKTQQIEP